MSERTTRAGGALAGPALGLLAALLLIAGLASAQRRPGGVHARGRGGAPADAAAGDGTPDDAALPIGADGGADGGASLADATDPDSFEARRQRAGQEFAEGLAAYRRAEYLQAAEHFRAAYEELPDPAPLFNMARSWEAANEIRNAIEAYQQYLHDAPAASDRADVLAHIEQLRSRPGFVSISTTPPGAFIYVDNSPQHAELPTNATVELPPGHHVIMLEHAGYQRTSRDVEVTPGSHQDVSIFLQREQFAVLSDGSPAPANGGNRAQARILARRAGDILSYRFSFLAGAARPWKDQPLSLSFGAEATAFLGRYVTARLHLERVEPDGVWTILTSDFGVTFPIEDLDIGVFLTAGTGWGWMTFDQYDQCGLGHNRTVATCTDPMGQPISPQTVVVGGGELRIDYFFHPYLSVGAYFRATWRNLLYTGPLPDVHPESLNSFGLSVSLSF